MVEHECKAKLYSAAAKAQLSEAGKGAGNDVDPGVECPPPLVISFTWDFSGKAYSIYRILNIVVLDARFQMRGYRYIARMLKALAHPTRLALLRVLQRDGECCVCHLEHALGKRQAYISQQLARLRQAGLVVDRRDGLNVYYALSLENTGELLDGILQAARDQADFEGRQIDFEATDLDRGEACPCPKCTGGLEKIALALEKRR
jgi:ArsR family transcriptional regulator